eukprot:2266220-Alexandrium_andersonii.AAC.1
MLDGSLARTSNKTMPKTSVPAWGEASGFRKRKVAVLEESDGAAWPPLTGLRLPIQDDTELAGEHSLEDVLCRLGPAAWRAQ